jgi:hypothetical protein
MCTESIVQELNFPNSSVEDVQLKIKTISTSYTAELNKAIKSGEKMAQVYANFIVPKLFWFKQAHYSCVAFVFHELQCQIRLIFSLFLHSLIYFPQTTLMSTRMISLDTTLK